MRLGADMTSWVTRTPSTMSNTYIHVKSEDVARHMALIEAGEAYG